MKSKHFAFVFFPLFEQNGQKSIQAIGFTWISPYLFWKEKRYSWCCESERDPIQNTLCSFEFISFCFFGCLQPLTLKTGSLCSFASFFFSLSSLRSTHVAELLVSFFRGFFFVQRNIFISIWNDIRNGITNETQFLFFFYFFSCIDGKTDENNGIKYLEKFRISMFQRIVWHKLHLCGDNPRKMRSIGVTWT